MSVTGFEELRDRWKKRTNAQAVVQSGYNTILGREYDRPGFEFYTQAIESGDLTPEQFRQQLQDAKSNDPYGAGWTRGGNGLASATSGWMQNNDVGNKTTDVAKIAADYASENNALMDRARTEGLQIANRRGLLNSSVAAGESMNAVLDRVVPMAQQESEQRYGYMRSDQDFAEEGRLREQDYFQRRGLQQEEFDFRAREEQRQRELELGLAEFDADTRRELMQMETAARERVAAMELQEARGAQISDMIISLQGQYQTAFQSILNNKELSAEARADYLRNIGNRLNVQLDMIEGLYGIDLSYGGGGTGGGAGGIGGPSGWSGDYMDLIEEIPGERMRDPTKDGDDGNKWIIGPPRYRVGGEIYEDKTDALIAAIDYANSLGGVGGGTGGGSGGTGNSSGSGGSGGISAGNAANIVEQAYSNILGRDYDQAGFDFWTNQLTSGNVTPEEFRSALSAADDPLGPGWTRPSGGGGSGGNTGGGSQPNPPASVNKNDTGNSRYDGYNGDYSLAIKRAYVDVLGRAADSAGFNFWRNKLEAGNATMSTLIAALKNSPEGRGGSSSGGSSGGSSNSATTSGSSTSGTKRPGLSSPAAASIVGSAYRDILGREYDQAGFDFWTKKLIDGDVSPDEFRSALRKAKATDPLGPGWSRDGTRSGPQPKPIKGSKNDTNDPRYNIYGGKYDTAIRRAYVDVLGRQADAAGFDFWKKQVDTGKATMSDVLAALRNSPEGRGVVRYNTRTGKLEPV